MNAIAKKITQSNRLLIFHQSHGLDIVIVLCEEKKNLLLVVCSFKN